MTRQFFLLLLFHSSAKSHLIQTRNILFDWKPSLFTLPITDLKRIFHCSDSAFSYQNFFSSINNFFIPYFHNIHYFHKNYFRQEYYHLNKTMFFSTAVVFKINLYFAEKTWIPFIVVLLAILYNYIYISFKMHKYTFQIWKKVNFFPREKGIRSTVFSIF